MFFAADEFDRFGLDYLLTEDNLRDTDGENPYEYASAHIFLMGSCNLFALALNEKFGCHRSTKVTKATATKTSIVTLNYRIKNTICDINNKYAV